MACQTKHAVSGAEVLPAMTVSAQAAMLNGDYSDDFTPSGAGALAQGNSGATGCLTAQFGGSIKHDVGLTPGDDDGGSGLTTFLPFASVAGVGTGAAPKPRSTPNPNRDRAPVS